MHLACAQGLAIKRYFREYKMKAVIYCQLQHDLPECLWSSLKKTRELWEGDIYLIAPARERAYKILKDLNIKVVAREEIKHHLIDDYLKHTFFPALYPEWDGFWDNACKRFPYILALMEMFGIDEAFHVENDVVVYLDIEKMFKECKRVYGDKIVFTPHEYHHLNCGFTYFGSRPTIFCEQIVNYFKRGVEWFRSAYPDDPIINETLFTYLFALESPQFVGKFPALPTDTEYKDLGFLVDPDGWGRLVDGVRYEPGKPFVVERHYIGHEILAGRYNVQWGANIQSGKMVPVVTEKGKESMFELATLHFNSKRSWLWI